MSQVDEVRVSRMKRVHFWVCTLNVALLVFGIATVNARFNPYLLVEVVMGCVFVGFAVIYVHFPRTCIGRSRSTKILLILYFPFSAISTLFMITSASLLWPISGIFPWQTEGVKNFGDYMFFISCFLLGVIPTIHSISVLIVWRNRSNIAARLQNQERTRWMVGIPVETKCHFIPIHSTIPSYTPINSCPPPSHHEAP
ncbi:unnamed protein product [Moneuplotes crassus]|uniref:Uncharacterized protein n=1 Tax=Euplotes crassus TaxID=5936 RepID=A0AAD1XIJ6_EUPCR|nr:unnamed protein product [Moneuplotes crassus]